jgi:hypothetical protein
MEDTKNTPKKLDAGEVNNTVQLTRAVPATIFGGTWFDVWRRPGKDGPDTFVLWSPVAPLPHETHCSKLGIFGSYLDERRARAAANTMLAITRKELSLVPVQTDLIATFMDEGMDAVSTTLINLADYLPEGFYGEEEEERRVMPELTLSERDQLTRHIESMEGACTNWLMVMAGPDSQMEFAEPGMTMFVRFLQGEVVAAVPFTPDIYTKPQTMGFVLGQPRRFSCFDPVKVDGIAAMLHPRFSERLQELTSRVDEALMEDGKAVLSDNSAVNMIASQTAEVHGMLLSAFFGHKVSQLGNSMFGVTVKKKINETVLQ